MSPVVWPVSSRRVFPAVALAALLSTLGAGPALAAEAAAAGNRRGPGQRDCPDGAGAAGAPVAPAPPDPERVRAVLLALDHEPPVDEVQRWTESAARLQPEIAQELLRDARSRGALPLVRLRGRYEDAAERSWDALDLLKGRSRDSDWTLDLWLEWDFAELATGPDHLRAVREERASTELRHAVLAQVNAAYFDRRRLLLEAALQPQDGLAAALERRLRVQELDATLDALTAGRWSRAVGSPPLPSIPEPPPPPSAGASPTLPGAPP